MKLQSREGPFIFILNFLKRTQPFIKLREVINRARVQKLAVVSAAEPRRT